MRASERDTSLHLKALRRDWLPLVVSFLGGLGVIGLFVQYTSGYFFLFDDFALIHTVETYRIRDLLAQPHFGFYRPFAFVAMKLQFHAFAWSAVPYQAVGITVHLATAVLSWFLCRRLELDRRSASVAALLVALSPWATEAYLWLSGVFDRFAALGLIAALVFGLAALDERSPFSVVAFAMASVLSTGVAILSKEHTVIIPVLFCSAAVLTRRTRGMMRWRLVAIGGCQSALVVAYLLARGRVLPSLGSTYGDAGALARDAHLAANALAYAHALITLPAPGVPRAIRDAFMPVAAAISLFLIVRAVTISGRLVLVCAAGFTLLLLPVLFVAITPGNSSAGRLLYLPGIWVIIAFAAGLGGGSRATAASEHPSGIRRTVATAAAVCGVLLASVYFVSVVAQARIWQQASSLSRSSIDQLRPYVEHSKPLFISNLPFAFAEGPYILKDYAFRFYYRRSIALRARPMLVRTEGPRLVFGGWIDPSVSPEAAPNEELVELHLPIEVRQPHIVSRIESPVANAVLHQPFTVRGWAIDSAAREDSGVNLLHVYAYSSSGAAAFLGAAEREERPDVSHTFGNQFLLSGFRLTVRSLRPGSYLLVIHPNDTVSATLANALILPITVSQ